ncbi:MAG: hypothetical protein ACM3PY_13605 [Omnitrophica WOR_2 bacterium]
MNIIQLLLGVLLLTLGRRLFWLFVGGVGFIIGINLATQLLGGLPQWVIVLIALVIGVIGAWFAVILQGFAIGAAGFLAGGYIATSLFHMLSTQAGGISWLIFIIGGILGAAFLGLIFDWALIILSSIFGAQLIIQFFHPDPSMSGIVLIVLILVGIAIQSGIRLLTGAKRRPDY